MVDDLRGANVQTRVVHISNEAHALLKKHCARNAIRIKDFVDSLVLETLTPKATAVDKKALIKHETGGNDGTPWERPAFWEKKDKSKGKEKEEDLKGKQ